MESSLGCQFQPRYLTVPLKCKILDHGLRTFRNLKGNIDLWFTINDVRFDFNVFVTPVFVKRGDALHALTQQLVAKLPAREHKPVWLNRDLLHKDITVDMLIATKTNSFHLVPRTFIYVVNQVDIRRLDWKIGGHLRVKIAFALKEVD